MTFGVERDWEKTSRKQEKHISWKTSTVRSTINGQFS